MMRDTKEIQSDCYERKSSGKRNGFTLTILARRDKPGNCNCEARGIELAGHCDLGYNAGGDRETRIEPAVGTVWPAEL